MDLLKIAGLIAIAAFLFSIFSRAEFNQFFSSITGMFSNILKFIQPKQQEIIYVDIKTSNFILNSKNINFKFFGKVDSLTLSSLGIKIKRENNSLEISNFEGSIEISNNTLKIAGKTNYFSLNEIEINTLTDIVASLNGKIENLKIESVDKVSIRVKEGEITIRKGESSTKMILLNKEVVLTDVKSLEYNDGIFSIMASNINREDLI